MGHLYLVFLICFKANRRYISLKILYSVWLRHLVKLKEAGSKNIPKRIIELGPGDSLGVGLAALLSGSDQYTALDVHKYSDIKSNLKIFDELIELFKKREPIPNGKRIFKNKA